MLILLFIGMMMAGGCVDDETPGAANPARYLVTSADAD